MVPKETWCVEINKQNYKLVLTEPDRLFTLQIFEKGLLIAEESFESRLEAGRYMEWFLSKEKEGGDVDKQA